MSELVRPKIFGTGLVALDLVISADPEKPIQTWAGGTCGNVMSILAYLGWDSYPIARISNDAAAARVTADLKRWGVHLDFMHSGRTISTPIVVQENRVSRSGEPQHRFTWHCPQCGSWLPSFRPVTTDVVEAVGKSIDDAAVFFLDRLSPAALRMASRASEAGALVIFEPSGRGDPRQFSQALEIAHIVKYADQRLNGPSGIMTSENECLLEIQTLGARGLRFRRKMGLSIGEWRTLSAVPAVRIVDTCGSGDWCTAGIVSRLGHGGIDTFLTHSESTVVGALKYGQKLAAWNCEFEGARGGMYFDAEAELTALARTSTALETDPTNSVQVALCPSCP